MNTEIICIADRSGSMLSLRQDVIGGFNAFLAEQRAVAGEARITQVQFNGEVATLYRAMALADAPELREASYIPMGSTALFDAIGMTLEAEGKRIAEEGWAELVIVNIVTDGEENTSTHYTLGQVKQMIAHAQDEAGWKFVFQAANQDAFATGHNFGIAAAGTHNFTASPAGVAEAYGNMSYSTTTLRSGGAL